MPLPCLSGGNCIKAVSISTSVHTRKTSFEKIMVDSYFMYTQEANSLDPDRVQIVCIDYH